MLAVNPAAATSDPATPPACWPRRRSPTPSSATVSPSPRASPRPARCPRPG